VQRLSTTTPPLKILALETATEACSAAVWQDGEVIERFELGLRHSQRILSMVEEVLVECGSSLRQMDALAYSRGPGSFTGLRIGAGVAQGLAYGADLPVVPVSTLLALAQGQDAGRVLAALDARMGQVYWGLCADSGSGKVLMGPERVSTPKDLVLSGEGTWVGVGSGWDAHAPALLACLGSRISAWLPGIRPRARHVAELGARGYAGGSAVAAQEALPLYVRDDVAQKSSERR
jgi:tRNA threonylcarbamoyladenosine biosynthesis protein TsaB